MTRTWKKWAAAGLSAMLVISMLPAQPTEAKAKKAALKPAKVTISVGQKKKLKLKRKPAGAKITWKSSNEKVAKVNKKGVVKGKRPGKATIKVKIKPKNGKAYKLKSRITVKAAASTTPTTPTTPSTPTTQAPTVKVTGIAANVTEQSMKVGDTFTIQTAVSPANATNKALTFTSSDTKVADVNKNGVVTAKKGGTAVITITAQDGSNVSTKINIDVAYETANTGKVRTVVTTDGEVDDQDSFMRLMLYANEMDIAGIIMSSSTFHYAGGTMQDGTVVEPYRWTGTEWIYDVLDRYEEVYPNLCENADGYPEPGYLKSITKIGNIKNVGDMEESTEGSDFLKDILLDDDDRTLYIQTWGGTNTTARALYDIEQEYKGTAQWDEIYNKICDKAVIYIILSQDDTFENYIAKNWPDISIIHDQGTFWRFAYMWKSVDEELTTRLQGDWNYKNIKTGHGPLLDGYHLMGDGTLLPGELDNEQRGSEDYLINNPQYSRYDFISEGDSPSFFYLLDTGLRSMEDPTYGGWGGRFGVDTDGAYRNIVKDYNPYSQKEDGNYTLTRWFDDIQDDFAARADWCVKSYDKANHRPTVSVKEGLDLTAAAGERVKLHANATDPDGDDLTYKWWQYYEADTYDGESDGELSAIGTSTDTVSFVVPEDAEAGDTIHMIIEVEDDGAHGMKHYQRVIVTVAE